VEDLSSRRSPLPSLHLFLFNVPHFNVLFNPPPWGILCISDPLILQCVVASLFVAPTSALLSIEVPFSCSPIYTTGKSFTGGIRTRKRFIPPRFQTYLFLLDFSHVTHSKWALRTSWTRTTGDRGEGVAQNAGLGPQRPGEVTLTPCEAGAAAVAREVEKTMETTHGARREWCRSFPFLWNSAPRGSRVSSCLARRV
jgi:hypothetical protein